MLPRDMLHGEKKSVESTESSNSATIGENLLDSIYRNIIETNTQLILKLIPNENGVLVSTILLLNREDFLYLWR